ncbi:MAG: hypothetical protein IPL39_09215 [Opitutaceae bacterium]|nr:hypothetical protein [Opitutaceae bacterium]
MKPKLAWVLPAELWTEREITRADRHVLTRFGDSHEIVRFAQTAERHQVLLKVPVAELWPTDGREFDIVVAAEEAVLTRWARARRVYTINAKGVFRHKADRLDAEEYPFLDAHIFNQLSPQKSETFYFTPYGTQTLFTGAGPLDAFGHRNAFDYRELEQRDPNLRVIAILGGSAAYGVDCIQEDTFPQRLEVLLNSACAERGSALRFRCVTFAQPGLVVLEQTIRYVLFCHRLRPEIVIGHDGWNDLVHGMVCDPFLLTRHEMCYRVNLEDWAQLLHHRETVPLNSTRNPARAVNLPGPVIEAYLSRKLMLKRVVEGNGGAFVAGFQPALFSKEARSANEALALETGRHRNHPAFAEIFDRHLPTVFSKTSEAMSRRFDFPHIDFSREFSRYGVGADLIYDRVHTAPEGERVIAEVYAQFILRHHTETATAPVPVEGFR